MHSTEEQRKARREITLVVLGFIGLVALIIGGTLMLMLSHH